MSLKGDSPKPDIHHSQGASQRSLAVNEGLCSIIINGPRTLKTEYLSTKIFYITIIINNNNISIGERSFELFYIVSRKLFIKRVFNSRVGEESIIFFYLFIAFLAPTSVPPTDRVHPVFCSFPSGIPESRDG